MVVSNSLFYSTMAFSFILAMIFLNLVYLDAIRLEDQQDIARVRALAFSDYVRSLSADFSRAVDVSCKRALLAASNDVISSGPLDNASYRIKELCLNETLRGVTPDLMSGQSLGGWINASMEKGARKGFQVSMTPSMSVLQKNAFVVSCIASAELDATDPLLNATFSKNVSATSEVWLDEYPDPMFSVGTGGVAVRSIHFTAKPIQGAALVDEAVSHGYYQASSAGASFLDRLEGSFAYTGRNPGAENFSGLESFINLEDFTLQGIQSKENQSLLDFYYFNASEISGFAVANSSLNWLKLDLETMGRYGLSPA